MLTTATEKVKLWRVAYVYTSSGIDEHKVKYFTDAEEAIKFVKYARLNTHMYLGEIFADEVTAVVTYNT